MIAIAVFVCLFYVSIGMYGLECTACKVQQGREGNLNGNCRSAIGFVSYVHVKNSLIEFGSRLSG